jgi:hypothetical protein
MKPDPYPRNDHEPPALVGERSPNEAAQYLNLSLDDLKAKRGDPASNRQWQSLRHLTDSI